MISAIDTNIFLDILRPNPDFMEQSKALLDTACLEGPLLICEIVYAELATHFNDRADLNAFLDDYEISIQQMGEDVCFLAAHRWLSYRKAGGKRERILPDFLIGAHALANATRLLTRDRGFYYSYFKDLTVIERVH